jgi:DNA polymerase III alpha subunit
MVVMTVLSHKTELKDRVLWHDGDSTVSEDYIMEMVSEGKSINGLFVDVMSEDIKKYNSLVSSDQEITVKTDVGIPNLDFNIPEEYANLNVVEYVGAKLETELGDISSEKDVVIRVNRTRDELLLYKKLKLFNVLRTLIFVINTLQDKNVVFGVGRGSSVASYVLYLIGVHDVDSIKYDLNISEFLRH